jgi:hypothetical protein
MIDDLRRAYRDRPAGDAPTSPCPAPERLEAAATDRCPAGEFNRILDHTVECAACAAGWRIARELRDEEAGASPAAPRRTPVPAWALAAAAVLAVAVGATLLPRWIAPSRAPVYRSNETPTVRSEIEDGSVLPRDRVLLRWSCDLEDAVFSVRVMDTDLNPLAAADHLEQGEYLVPQEALAGLESGDVVLWRVEAFHPDGPQAPSPVFSIRLE